jgi:hypothetical protein
MTFASLILLLETAVCFYRGREKRGEVPPYTWRTLPPPVKNYFNAKFLPEGCKDGATDFLDDQYQRDQQETVLRKALRFFRQQEADQVTRAERDRRLKAQKAEYESRPPAKIKAEQQKRLGTLYANGGEKEKQRAENISIANRKECTYGMAVIAHLLYLGLTSHSTAATQLRQETAANNWSIVPWKLTKSRATGSMWVCACESLRIAASWLTGQVMQHRSQA